MEYVKKFLFYKFPNDIMMRLTRKRKTTQTGEMDTKGGLMELRLEGRWDKMEKEERSIQQQ